MIYYVITCNVQGDETILLETDDINKATNSFENIQLSESEHIYKTLEYDDPEEEEIQILYMNRI